MRGNEAIMIVTRPLCADDARDELGWPTPRRCASFDEAEAELEAWVLRARAQAVEDATMQLAFERLSATRRP